ncbi:sugar phosphate nucleotidyltransferase [Bdellovibrionota bacterium FG-2]
MNQKNLFLIVMAGGSGTRFWPKSTSRKPKQLLSFSDHSAKDADPQTLLTQTLARFSSFVPAEQNWIVTTQLLEEAVRADSPKALVLAEPQGRNTAPCIYWAAQEVMKQNPEGVMLVMPADHFMKNPAAFQKTVKTAIEWAITHEDLITLGIRPSRPETGYGYLKVGVEISKDSGCRTVEAFVEKPNVEKAASFVREGYLWNGGMFVWRASTILKAFDRLMPEMAIAWKASQGSVERAYPNMTATSIDYGIMEKSQNVVSFELDCGWDDLGNWTSLDTMVGVLGTETEAGVVLGGEVISVDSKHNVIDVAGKLVALLGIEDLVIVQTEQALLIARKDRAQDIRKIVDQVKIKRPELA